MGVKDKNLQYYDFQVEFMKKPIYKEDCLRRGYWTVCK